MVTTDEIDDSENLFVSLDINGEGRQDGSIKTIIFGGAYLVFYNSKFMTLEPDEIVSTGPPPGIGMKPQLYLNEGDTMPFEIMDLGKQKQNLVSF